MARLFPNAPAGLLAPEVLRLFRLLRALPDDTYSVWQRLALDASPGPDFWVLHQDGRALLIKVSLATAAEARLAQQPRLFRLLASEAEPSALPGKVEQEMLVGWREEWERALSGPPAGLLGLVLFPNLSASDLRLLSTASLPSGIAWAGREVLAPDTFGA